MQRLGCHSPRNPRLGLSQLELLVSLAIMAMIAVLLANALNFNRQALSRVSSGSRNADYALNQSRLRSWIEDMPLRYGGGDAQDFFGGHTTRLRFKAVISDGNFWSGVPAEVTFAVSDQMLIATGKGTSSDRGGTREATLLLDPSVQSVSISYFGRVSGSAEKNWFVAWNDTKFLPDLVRIEWVRSDGDPAPPLTLQPARIERQREMSLSSLLPPG